MRSRYRVRSTSELAPVSVTTGGAVIYDGPYVMPETVSFRRSSDWTDKSCIGGRLPSTPCDDAEARFFPVDLGPWRSSNGFQYIDYSSGAFGWDPEYFLRDLVDRSPGAAPLAQKAFDAFSNQVPEDLSLGNFALEWREAANLIPSLVENFARAKPYLSQDGKRAIRGSSATDGASDAFLQWNFAVAPLIGDLEALAGLVQSTQKRLDEIRRLNGKTTRMGYTSRAPTPIVPALAPTVRLHIPGPAWHQSPRATLQEASGVFRARCSLRVQIPWGELDGMSGFCRTLFAKTGLNNPAGVIWNAIPFSFLLDWVFRFSDMLARRAIRPFTGEWAVEDLVWSLTQSTLWSVDQHVEDAPWVWRDIHRGIIQARKYTRGLGLPETELATLFKGGFSPKQAALLLALSRGVSR